MFRCETDRYGGIVFGAFDGIRPWQVNSFTTVDVLEQELVSAHEERHLRLQQGTPYGAALAVLGTAAGDADHLADEWTVAVDGCREVHETYATFMSVAHVLNGLDVLSGNLSYLDYWSVGDALFDRVNTEGTGLQVLEFLFHQLMAPRPSATAVEGSPAHLLPALRLLGGETPNDRLRSVVRLAQSDPRFVADLIDAVSASRTIEANLDQVAAVLEHAGMPTLTTGAQAEISREIEDMFNSGTHGHRLTMTIRSRATALEDQLDYISSERIHLHSARLPLLLSSDYLPDGVHPFSPFVRTYEGVGPHMWTVLLSGDALRRQFDTAIDDGIHFGFLSCDRECVSGLVDEPTAFFMSVDAAPEDLTRELAKAGLRTLTMTTLSSLASVVRSTPFSASEPLLVLVDERMRPFLLGLRDERPILWTTIAIAGDRLLHAVILTPDNDQPLHFIWVGTIYTLKPVLEWLRRERSAFSYVGEDYPDITAELFSALKHLVGTFYVLGAR